MLCILIAVTSLACLWWMLRCQGWTLTSVIQLSPCKRWAFVAYISCEHLHKIHHPQGFRRGDGEGAATITSFQATHKCHNTSQVGIISYHFQLLLLFSLMIFMVNCKLWAMFSASSNLFTFILKEYCWNQNIYSLKWRFLDGRNLNIRAEGSLGLCD